ncbi:MAG TPA: hypothetical protein VF972_10545, partial [Actinomycetota bacterium]
MIVPSRTKRRLASRAVVAVAAASALLSPILPLEHSAALTRRPEFGTAVSGNLDLLGRPVALPDYEGPAARRSPTSDQLRMVRALGAHVQWTKYGTPASLIRYGAPLSAAMPGSAQQVARAWVRGHRVLFRLSGSDVRRLTVVNDSTLRWSPSHVVLFRQAFGGLPAGQDGMITVGVRNGRVYYVSSSAAGSESLTNRVALSPMQAWLHAAANVGLRVEATAVRAAGRADSWT